MGYETLIYDCLIGDATLFQRADQVEAAWALVEPVLQGWAEHHARVISPIMRPAAKAPSPPTICWPSDGRSWRAIRILGGK